jgi:hypothetical protein
MDQITSDAAETTKFHELCHSSNCAIRTLRLTARAVKNFLVGYCMAPAARLIPLVAGTSLVFLALLGGLDARANGAGVTIGAARVTIWGALAMALTAGVGALFERLRERGNQRPMHYPLNQSLIIMLACSES